jgi:hypothetical protein
MKHKHTATIGILFFIAVALLFLNASGCLAGSVQISATAVQKPNLEVSPFKGPSTAPVVITVFSDFQ